MTWLIHAMNIKTYQIHQTNVIQLSIKTLDVFEQNV